jgi:transposase-like protein
MPRGYPVLNSFQKQEIITRVKEGGEKVSDLSREYGVVTKAIYNLLGNQLDRSNAVLELAKVKREKEALLLIIGELVAESKLRSKSVKKN